MAGRRNDRVRVKTVQLALPLVLRPLRVAKRYARALADDTFKLRLRLDLVAP